jgi:hypothetical protein
MDSGNEVIETRGCKLLPLPVQFVAISRLREVRTEVNTFRLKHGRWKGEGGGAN